MSQKAKTQAEYSVLKAWKNTQPVRAPSLHIKGMVAVPAPDLDPQIRKEPEAPSDPEIYKVRVEFVERPSSLIPPPLRKEVEHVEEKYQGSHTEVEVLFPDNSRVRLPIELTV